MVGKPGRCKIIEQFIADGMTYMFGNPGTVEQGFLDALGDYPDMTYILALQESVAVLMADGYARAVQKPALVQLHSAPGVGNAVGALYQAKRGHAPLVVIGGDAGVRYMNMDAQMANDLVAMMEPVTKYATLVTDPGSLLRTLRRATKIAATPPMGPAYVCVPADILDMPCTEEVRPTSIPSTRVVAAESILREAAQILAGAQKPMLFIGDGIAYSGAKDEVEKLAELLGAEIWGVDSGELNVSYAHPLYQGQTGHMFGQSSYPVTSKGDVNLVVGTYMMPEVFPKLDNIYAEGARVIHIDLNAYEIAKNHPVDLGMMSDPKLTLSKLTEILETLLSDDQKRTAAKRAEDIKAAKEKSLISQREKDRRNRDGVSMHAARFMEELARLLPNAKDVCVFDEALTCSPELTRYLPPTEPGQFLQTRGGSLGVGIPGALALKLAYPGKTVFGFTGDGASMYTIQALWTAARYNIGAKLVICNNLSYMLLKLNILQYWRDQIGVESHGFPDSFSLTEPAVDFAALARSMGVPGVRVEKPEEIEPAIRQALEGDGPFLIDLLLTDEVPA